MRLIIISVTIVTAACTSEHTLGLSLPSELRARWVVPLGGDLEDVASGVAIDPAGDVIVAGSFRGQVEFGGGTASAPNTPYESGFITKRSSIDGSHVWTATLGGFSASFLDVETDQAGNVLALGSVSSDSSGGDMVLAKYSSDGALLWRRGLGESSGANPTDLAVGANGSSFVIGSFQGTADFGSGPVQSTPYDVDVFIVAWNSDGDIEWGRSFPAVGSQGSGTIAVAPDGDVVFSIGVWDPVSLGGSLLVGNEQTSDAIARHTSAGTHVWSQIPGPVDNEPYGGGIVTIDSDGQIVVVGSTQAGDEPILNVRGYDAGGTRLYEAEGCGMAAARASAVLDDGTRIVAGRTCCRSELWIGNQAIPATTFVSAHAADGSMLAASGYGFNEHPDGGPTALASVDARGTAIAVAGGLHGPVEFDGIFVEGYRDAVVMMFDLVEVD
jgi:hypothetical protein